MKINVSFFLYSLCFKKNGAFLGPRFLERLCDRDGHATGLLVVHAGELLQAEAVEGNKAGGVVLIVGFFLAAFHRGDVFVVEAVRGTATGVHNVAFVELEADFAVDRLLGLGDEGLEGVALGGKPEAIVDELGIGRNEAIAKVLGIAVDGEGFEVLVGSQKNGAAGGLVDAAAFHANEAVLDDVNAADAVSATEVVEEAHDTVGSEEGVAVLLALDLEVSKLANVAGKLVVFESDDLAFFEEALKIFGFVRGVLRGDGEDIHVLVGGGGAIIPSVLERAGFEGDVEEVPVHGVGLALGSLHVDIVLLTIGDHFGTAGEFFTKRIVTPWGDHFNVRREGIERELEADLVVSFSGGAVGDGVSAFGKGNIEHTFDDARAGDGGSKEVAAFVDGVGLEHRENVVGSELFLEIADVALGSAGREGLGF